MWTIGQWLMTAILHFLYIWSSLPLVPFLQCTFSPIEESPVETHQERACAPRWKQVLRLSEHIMGLLNHQSADSSIWAIKPAVFRADPVCIEMNWCFLNAQLRKEKAHYSLKRAWDWSSLCTASHCIRESCSFWQSDCGPSCKAAIMYFHMQSPLFV